MKTIIKCQYYKCNNEINCRKGAKFCCVSCKQNNRKMKKYWKNKKGDKIIYKS